MFEASLNAYQTLKMAKWMKGVNKVIIVGNLGNDPDIKSLPNGSMVTNISVATGESWTDKQTGQKQERTEWHRVAFFNRLAEIASQYLRKGSKVYVEGSLRTRKWQDQQGNDRYSTEIVGKEMQMLDSRQEDSQARAPVPHVQGWSQPQSNQQPQPMQPMQQQEVMDDDIPF